MNAVSLASTRLRMALKDSGLYLRNSTTRIPFRYGTAVLTRCPQAVLRVSVACDGVVQEGYSGDCLPPSWFDKSPEKDFRTQVADMLRVIGLSECIFSDAFRTETDFFPAWLECQQRVLEECVQLSLPPLLASFGSSLIERAMLDAACRRRRVSFAAAVRRNLFGIEIGEVYPHAKGLSPRDWLPTGALTSVHVRQTVGLGDPLTRDEIPRNERLRDGWPQAIEEYATRRGVRYYKVKVSNQLDHDVERLTRIAHLLERHLGRDYHLTLDGNEQYKRAEDFEGLVHAIGARPALSTLWKNVLAIEQPFDRAIALDAGRVGELKALSSAKPVIIDESDGTLDSYLRAIDIGYRGVSSKNCKGALRSLCNAGLTWVLNGRGERSEFIMTGEDLCSVGIIATQSDLCLAATLGLDHVERNGHHYHPGLTYLPEAQRRAALIAHGDFYAEEHGIVGPRIVNGRLQIVSLHCAGFGFAVEPDLSSMEPAHSWKFDSLGL